MNIPSLIPLLGVIGLTVGVAIGGLGDRMLLGANVVLLMLGAAAMAFLSGRLSRSSGRQSEVSR